MWPHRWEIRLWRSTVNPRKALHTQGPSSSSKPGAIKCCCFWGLDWAWCLIIVSLLNTWPLTDNHTNKTGVTAKDAKRWHSWEMFSVPNRLFKFVQKCRSVNLNSIRFMNREKSVPWSLHLPLWETNQFLKMGLFSAAVSKTIENVLWRLPFLNRVFSKATSCYISTLVQNVITKWTRIEYNKSGFIEIL